MYEKKSLLINVCNSWRKNSMTQIRVLKISKKIQKNSETAMFNEFTKNRGKICIEHVKSGQDQYEPKQKIWKKQLEDNVIKEI